MQKDSKQYLKEYLKEAFPEGYYAAPGVLSIGGYRCARVEEDASWWVGPDVKDPQNSLVCLIIGDANNPEVTQGEFLPDFSYADSTTWTQLMIYLGSLHTSTQEEAQYLNWCFAWIDAAGVLKDPCWGLIGHSSAAYPAGPMYLFPDIFTSNIEEALLEAIISSKNQAKS